MFLSHLCNQILLILDRGAAWKVGAFLPQSYFSIIKNMSLAHLLHIES